MPRTEKTVLGTRLPKAFIYVNLGNRWKTATVQVRLFQGQPLRWTYLTSTSRPSLAALAHVSSWQGQPLHRTHSQTHNMHFLPAPAQVLSSEIWPPIVTPQLDLVWLPRYRDHYCSRIYIILCPLSSSRESSCSRFARVRGYVRRSRYIEPTKARPGALRQQPRSMYLTSPRRSGCCCASNRKFEGVLL